MIAIKRGNLIDIYDVEVNTKKLRKLRNEIREKCSFVVEKKIPMGAERTNNCGNENLRILSSEPKSNYFLNTCELWHVPALVIYIDELFSKGNHESIVRMFNSLNRESKPTVTKIEVLNQCKKCLFTQSEEDLAELNRMISIYTQEKITKYPENRVRQYKDEVLECFRFTKVDSINITASNSRLKGTESFKLIPEACYVYSGFGKKENKVLRKVLKKADKNAANDLTSEQ